MNEDQRAASDEARASVEVGRSPGQIERSTVGRIRQRRERGQVSVGQELDEKRPGEETRPSGARDGRDDDEGEEKSGEPGYFRLMHFTRRHPLNMLTWVT
ncbi:MAG TPA: hypothetical protein VJZ73_20910, partial [Methylomirabilota bacterium]|nr:hypothetical protein [Methylomirabilota bacterium]